jgi:transcriptional regulator with XRE-family HTH domain
MAGSTVSFIKTIAFAVSDLRHRLRWTQAELGARAGFSQSFVSLVEAARLPDLTFESASRLLEAMGARITLAISNPYLGDRQLQRDPAHARCASYVSARLRRDGLLTATEVEVGGDRSRGWIDVLGYNPIDGQLLVIEIKTEIHDLGAIERTMGWYEREAWAAARRLGWRPTGIVGCLLLLATEMNETRIADNRAGFAGGFPIRAAELRRVITTESSARLEGRAMAVIDPRSRRREWLRPSRLDGRPTPPPYVDYADFVRADRAGRRRA